MRRLAMLFGLMLLSACQSDDWQVEYLIDPQLPDYQQDVWVGAVETWDDVTQAELGTLILRHGDHVTLTVYGDQPCGGETALGCESHRGGRHVAWLNWDQLTPGLRHTVAVHELGHVLGLKDLPCDSTAVMCNFVSESTPDITEVDLAEFRRAAAAHDR